MQVLVISGAGLSVGSGMPTYRGVGGQYTEIEARHGISVEEIVSKKTLEERPELLWSHWRGIHAFSRQANPSLAHYALRDLSEALGDEDFLEVTQNVDGLSLRAGVDPKCVVELHGSTSRYVCTKCGGSHEFEIHAEMAIPPRCFRCRDPQGAVIRPDVVLFGEMLDERKFNRALDFSMTADLVIIVGTTLQFPYLIALLASAAQRGARIIYIDPMAEREHPMFYIAPNANQVIEATRAVRVSADEGLPKLVQALKASDPVVLAEFGL